MAINRRKFMKIAGSSAVILAAGGTACSFGDTGTANRPWSEAGKQSASPLEYAVSYAILAPNPHNRQPWLIDLRSATEGTLYCDLNRTLPETDPYGRQIVIGLGCFLEVLRIAAAEAGFGAEIETFPEGADERVIDARPVAHIRLVRDEGIARDPLFHQILKRRSNKEPYETDRPVAAGILTALRQATGRDAGVGVSAESGLVGAVRDLSWRALKIEIETPRTYMESVNLMRIGKAEIEANPDGIDLGGPMMETLKMFGLMNREVVADPTSMAYRQGLEMFVPVMNSAMAYAWIATDGNDRQRQIETGGAYVRLNLKATELGLGMHPISQALQEYPEMTHAYEEIHGLLGVNAPRRVQMLARLGYGPDIEASPRWPAETRMRRA